MDNCNFREGKELNRRDFLKYSAGTAAAIAFASSNLGYAAEKASASDDVVEKLLRGAIDLHMHAGPDVVPRKQTYFGLAHAANKARLRAIVLKSHMTPTTSLASDAQEALGGQSSSFWWHCVE
jgi:anaerobic selenocysteine-containing dehydrogenase